MSDIVKQNLVAIAKKLYELTAPNAAVTMSDGDETHVRFVTPLFERLLPQTGDRKSGWKNGRRFLYEYECSKNGIELVGVISAPKDAVCVKLIELSTANREVSGCIEKKPRMWCHVFRRSILDKTGVKEGLTVHAGKVGALAAQYLSADIPAYERLITEKFI
jgi:hypothetical protein